MLPLTLIAILSIGLIEGLDPYRGLLFSYYFYTFNKVKESYLIPIISTISYYILGLLVIIFFINFDYTQTLRLIMFSLLILHSSLKVLMGKVMHY
ncbi:MAG: hypothetical protein QW183_07985, partial [Saccharolobus sp.]